MRRWIGLLLTVGVAHAQTPQLTPLSPTEPELEVIQAIGSPPPGLSARELGVWQLRCLGLLNSNANFIREDVFAFTSQAGIAPRVFWTNQWVRIQIVAPKGGESAAARMLEAMLGAPDWSEERLFEARSALASPLSDDGLAMVLGLRGDTALPAEVARRLNDRVWRPERFYIAATPGALRALSDRFREWRPARVPADNRPSASATFRGPERSQSRLLTGPPLKPTTREAPRLLAMLALGGGKTALLHQVLREQKGWSYRQEAFLLPEAEGWRPHVLILGSEPLPENAALMEALSEATLTTQDLERLRNLAESALAGRNPLSPFWLSLDGPFSGSWLDRSAWQAQMSAWGTPLTTPESLRADLKRVSLPELQEALKQLLADLK